jgi:hypothetical protein
VDAIGDLVAEAVRVRGVEGHMGVSRPTVIAWRARYEEPGIGGLVDGASVGPSAQPRSRRDRFGHVEAAATETWCHALEFTPAGRPVGDQFLGGS